MDRFLISAQIPHMDSVAFYHITHMYLCHDSLRAMNVHFDSSINKHLSLDAHLLNRFELFIGTISYSYVYLLHWKSMSCVIDH